MLEALKCPACAASLEYPKDGSPLRCPYCNTTIAQDRSAPDGRLRLVIDKSALQPVASAARIVVGSAIAVAVIIIVSIIGVVHSATKHDSKPVATSATPAVPRTIVVNVPTLPAAAPKPPPPPAFARMVQEFGVEGVGPGRFQDAESIALDGLGHVYVGEISGGRIQVFDLNGKFLTQWNTGSVKHLLALAADRKGIVYADAAPQILRFEGLTGKPLGPVDDMNTGVEEFYRDVFCTVDGVVYAIGGDSHIIQLDADGKIKNTLRANDKIGEVVALRRVLVQSTGEIYALDPDRGIFKFAADGHYINRFGAGQGKDHLSSPRNLASDSKGRIYVSDEAPSIRVFDPGGSPLDAFGSNDSAFGVAISDSNDIYATFANRHVVRKYALEKP